MLVEGLIGAPLAVAILAAAVGLVASLRRSQLADTAYGLALGCVAVSASMGVIEAALRFTSSP